MKYIAAFLGGALALAAIVGGYFYYQSRIYDDDMNRDFMKSFAISELRDAVMDIELYRLVFGAYPETLKQMRGGISFYDSLTDSCKCGESSDFHYVLDENGKTYQLFSKGPDCQSGTADDLQPDLTASEKAAVGWRVPPEPVTAAKVEVRSCARPGT